MEAVLKYPGAKNRLAEWIISFIPEHRVYLELFFGSGAVFFNKDPAKIETLNDLDGEEVLISGYDNDLYNEILNGWSKAQKQTQAEHGLKRIETVWFNYEKEYQLKF